MTSAGEAGVGWMPDVAVAVRWDQARQHPGQDARTIAQTYPRGLSGRPEVSLRLGTWYSLDWTLREVTRE